MEFSGETPAEPGVRRHWLASFFAVGDGVGGVVVEDTARHRAAAREHDARRAAETARARAEALTRVTAALGSSMRTPRVLAGLVDAVVPSLADFCAVHLVRDGGRGIEPIAVAAADRSQTDLARALADLQAADGAAPVGPAAVARTGVPEINVEITPADLVREGVPGPERDALAALGHPLGRGPAAVGARRGARLADAGDGQLRPRATRPSSSSSPRASPRAPGSRSTTRGCSPSRKRSRGRSSARCSPRAAGDPGRPARRPLSRVGPRQRRRRRLLRRLRRRATASGRS